MILQMTVPVQGGLRQEKQLEIIANHIANASTTGFKPDILTFDETFRASLTIDHRQGAWVLADIFFPKRRSWASRVETTFITLAFTI